ncbi:TetR/AcrR family transcriptional regulator [Paenibacillus sepulcri]|uniref:TetR/AcrR family transcriptional regulator n=1 Tax=Paenibacillus sepulcri TaxID=359917 RepID=A0ABS7BX60_9BACL|nr:TetR/AcrR family transcriptional regulator [Paenibacillus sepulcri]
MKVRKERKDAIEHRRIILQKAQLLFAEFGVDGVTMHQIAKSAGIGQGTLYRRYAHKGEICQDLMKESSEDVCEDIQNYLDNKDLPLRERITMALEIALNFIESHSDWLVSIQAPTCEERQTLYYQSDLYINMHKAFHDLILETEPAKETAKDAVFIADMILASLNPELFLFMRNERGYTKEEIKHKLISLYIDPLFC